MSNIRQRKLRKLCSRPGNLERKLLLVEGDLYREADLATSIMWNMTFPDLRRLAHRWLCFPSEMAAMGACCVGGVRGGSDAGGPAMAVMVRRLRWR